MIAGFAVEQKDMDLYRSEFESRLPSTIIDGHAHLWNKQSICVPKSEYAIHKQYKPWTDFDLFEEFLLEDYQYCAGKLFPGKEFIGSFFGLPFEQVNRNSSNEYILEKADQNNIAFYYMPGQYENAFETEKKYNLMSRKGFIGFKPYPDLAKVESGEVGLYDMLNHSVLEFADKNRLHIMLHVPGKRRLKDEKLRSELTEAIRKYNNATFIIAHAGRAFCYCDIDQTIDFLVQEENVLFDTALLNDPLVLEYLIRIAGSSRVLFGSDAPLAFTKGKDVCINNKHYYVSDTVVPWGLGPGNPKLLDLTYYIYEEIRSILYAVDKAYPQQTQKHVENIFYNNAKQILRQHGL